MRGGSAILVLAALSGCGRSCKNDHPYVPYSIGEAGPEAEDASAALAVEDAGQSGIAATAAPPGATQWVLDGLELGAPAGRVFVLGVAYDFDGDGAKDALAVVRPAQEAQTGAVVLFFKGKSGPGPARVAAGATVATMPAPPPDPSCVPSDKLAQVGKRSAAVELGAACKGQMASTRSLFVLTFDRGARTHFSATLVDPPNAPKLVVDVDGSDRDSDGIDDVLLRVTIDAPNAPFEPMPRATARLAWFDRSAGLSRDPDEPEASLRALAQAASAKAGRPKNAPEVPALVHQVRALYAAMCPEAGAPRISKVSVGSGSVTCGASRALEEAGLALAHAHATMGDPVRAAWALDRAQLPPATRTASRAAEGAAWIAAVAPVATAKELRAIAAVPNGERGTAPAWGPLVFEPNGKLLVRTAAGVVRVDPEAGDEAEAPDVPPWRSHVLSPDGALRWIEAYSACDNVVLHATFAPTGDAELKDVLLPIAPALGTRCAAGKGEPARALPLSWGPRGLEALVAGEPLLFSPDLARASLAAAPLDQPIPPGSPRSPGGRAVAVATSQGIAVRTVKARLYRAKELDGGYLELTGCTVSDDATRVACVRGGRAFVGIWDAS